MYSELKPDASEQECHNPPAEDASSSNISFLDDGAGGKPGLVSFYRHPYRLKYKDVSIPATNQSTVIWFFGPAVLVASFIFPSLYLRRILSTIFEDSLLTGMTPHSWGTEYHQQPCWYLSLIIPMVTMGFIWPWTDPAASATLASYLVGIVVQYAFEQYAKYCKSASQHAIPIIFQVYRLHQLNRAAQLVTALSFTVRGAGITPTVNGSLSTLLNVLQVLGLICIWSLSSFIMRNLTSTTMPE